MEEGHRDRLTLYVCFLLPMSAHDPNDITVAKMNGHTVVLCKVTQNHKSEPLWFSHKRVCVT